MIVLTPFVVDGLWYTFIAVILSNHQLLDKLRSRAVWIDRVSGIVLIALAIRVLMTIQIKCLVTL
jgi:threonine/homoserine/homoserine lactone efflux protein